MAKKKRTKHPEKITPVVPEPAKLAPVSAKPFSQNTRKIIFLAALLILGFLFYFLLTKENSNQADANLVLHKLSEINFGETEPQVVEKIKSQQKQVMNNPESAALWGKLGMNLDIHDFKDESIVCYKKAAALNPNDFRWPYYAAIVLDEMGSAESLKFYKQSSTIKPDYPATHLRFGEALFQAKRLEEASREFNAALNTETNSSHAYVGLARIALTSGNYEAARTSLEKALQSNPNYGEAHGLLSEVYRRLNRSEDANRELGLSQQLPKKKPLQDKLELELLAEGVSSYWYDLRGRAYADQGYYEDAIRELKLAAPILARGPEIADDSWCCISSIQKVSRSS